MRDQQITKTYRELQQQICSQLENADGKSAFVTDYWKKELGHGYTMVLQNGNAIEKAAVNFSSVSGSVTNSMKDSMKIVEGSEYFATGISSIIHPKNPFVPITHMNVRYFELNTGLAWFGGGIDLTPHYINKKEASWFHKELKTICDYYDSDFYPVFKSWADNYFYLSHREETRGIGGIFFDYQTAYENESFEKLFDFTRKIAEAYPRIYIELLTKNRNTEFTEKEKNWQKLRRGRYVEFNLMYDHGTKFGIDSNGRVESIFLSMPPMANWEYNFTPKTGSKEEETLSLLKKDIDWINMNS